MIDLILCNNKLKSSNQKRSKFPPCFFGKLVQHCDDHAKILHILNNRSEFVSTQATKNRRRHSRKTEPDSEESDSDQDPPTSSRTESSNQLDAKIKHSNCN